MSQRVPWFAIRKPMPPRRALMLKVLSFCIPLAVWCAVSYVPWIWHPQMKITDKGGSTMYSVDGVPFKADFYAEQERLRSAGKPLMQAVPTNPVFLPEPHRVATAFYTAFTTKPRAGGLWLHEKVLQSLETLAKGFLLAVLVALPMGILCGTLHLFSSLVEPFVDFIRYMPAPAFGALMIAVFGFDQPAKVAIIFIGVFFNLLLVTANTTRLLDVSLLEAAQTLGAKRLKLLTHVVLPGVLPVLYNDLRIALGVGWVYLTVSEIIGAYSGITEFINLQGKRFQYADVFAGIMIIGLLGFITDQLLAWAGQILFPWHSRRPTGWIRKWIDKIRSDRNPLARPALSTGGVSNVNNA